MKTKLSAGAVLALAATGAVAQAPQWGAAPGLRDGVQTRAEAVQRAQQRFVQTDVNRDGFLTQQELRQGRQAMRQQRQRTVDPARRAQRTERAFARLDLNRDGMISRQEFTQRQVMRGERGMRGQRMAMRGGMGGRMFAMADRNRDNRLSLQEATGAALQRFDRTDLNRDGRVTREERLQFRQQWRRQQRG